MICAGGDSDQVSAHLRDSEASVVDTVLHGHPQLVWLPHLHTTGWMLLGERSGRTGGWPAGHLAMKLNDHLECYELARRGSWANEARKLHVDARC